MSTNQTDMVSLIAARAFRLCDQKRFADFSGDRNPMHLSELAARRTMAGTPAVHGMHQVLWALENSESLIPEGTVIRRICVRFPQFLPIEETSELEVVHRGPEALRLKIAADGLARSTLTLHFGQGRYPARSLQEPDQRERAPERCTELGIEQLTGLSGDLPVRVSEEGAQLFFPTAMKMIGGYRVHAIAALSRLVGMVCPGLHSIFSSLDIRLNDEADPNLHYEVISADKRFSLLRVRVKGGGIEGQIEAFVRTPPVSQLAVRGFQEFIQPGEFAGSDALVIGASRGLGEFVAKAIGAGGGNVIATYKSGKLECEQLVHQIRSVGRGRCEMMQYDTCKPAAGQLAALPFKPTSMYYFATPKIMGRTSELYDAKRFLEFEGVYVRGFFDLCSQLRKLGALELSVFYPSSAAVQSRPRDMTTYAMAKAAGEVLCDELSRSWPECRLIVRRLPRLPTDQTSTLLSVETSSIQEVMLPIVREVERRASSTTVS